nr:hypothetical protein [Treponema denticola]
MKNRGRKFTKYCGIRGSHIKNAGYSRIRITGIKKFKDVHSPTAMDGGCSILAMFCREEKLETQNRTRMSDFEYLCGKMCELKGTKPAGSQE